MDTYERLIREWKAGRAQEDEMRALLKSQRDAFEAEYAPQREQLKALEKKNNELKEQIREIAVGALPYAGKRQGPIELRARKRLKVLDEDLAVAFFEDKQWDGPCVRRVLDEKQILGWLESNERHRLFEIPEGMVEIETVYDIALMDR